MLTLDGFRGSPEALADIDAVESLLAELAELLDPGATPQAHQQPSAGGVSALSVSPESQLTIHTFPTVERVAFRAFSRRILPVITLSERVRVRFGVGRVESQLRHRATLVPPAGQVSMDRVLAGERAYARLRLEDLPMDAHSR